MRERKDIKSAKHHGTGTDPGQRLLKKAKTWGGYQTEDRRDFRKDEKKDRKRQTI